MDLKRKLGPLPVWAWILIGGAVAYVWKRHSSSSSTSAQSNQNQVDPSNPLGLTYAQETADLAAGIDPNTGTTFASEQAAAQQGSAGGGGSGSGASSSDPALVDALNGIQTQISLLTAGSGVTDQLPPGQTLAGEVADIGAGLSALQGLSAYFAVPPTATGAPGVQPDQGATIRQTVLHKGQGDLQGNPGNLISRSKGAGTVSSGGSRRRGGGHDVLIRGGKAIRK